MPPFRLIVTVPILALLAACAEPTVEIPSIEGWTGESQVAAALTAAGREARADPTAANLGRLGEIFHAHDLFTEAIVCYRQVMALEPENPRWPYLAGLAAKKLDLESSLPHFERAAELGADHPALFVHLGDTLAQLGRDDEAGKSYRRALTLAPGSTHARLGLAQIALARGEVETALEQLEEAREIAPWHGEVHLLLARVYQRLGRIDDAERELLVADAYPDATQEPDSIFQGVRARAVNSMALVDRGRRLARAGRFEDAEKQYRRVLEIRPGTANDHSNLGGSLARQGKVAEAVAEYEKALEVDPDNAAALNNLAMALAATGDFEDAVSRLERAIAADPAYPEAHHNLGLVRARQGRGRQAVEHYREALRHNQSLARVHNDLAIALAGLGETQTAVESWRLALAIDPRELSALYNLAGALAGAGQHGEARDWLERGLEIAPNSSRIASRLAWQLATAPTADQRDGKRAVDLARRVAEAYPDQPAAGDVLAASLAEAGRFEEAVSTAERAVTQATRAGQAELARLIAGRLEGYRLRQPHRQAGD